MDPNRPPVINSLWVSQVQAAFGFLGVMTSQAASFLAAGRFRLQNQPVSHVEYQRIFSGSSSAIEWDKGAEARNAMTIAAQQNMGSLHWKADELGIVVLGEGRHALQEYSKHIVF